MATYKLKVTGMVNNPKALSIDDLKKLGSRELVAGFECSGNRGPLQGLSGNGKWTGVPLKTVIAAAGLKPEAQATSCSSAPITARKKSSGARRNTRSTTTSAAACRARRRSATSRSWRGRSTASR